MSRYPYTTENPGSILIVPGEFCLKGEGVHNFLAPSPLYLLETNYRRFDMADVKPIPEGYHSVTPYLIIDGATAALDFYKKAFGAVELFRMEHEGKIGHAEIKIGDSRIMLADEQPNMGYVSPQALGGTPVSLMIYVDDVDTIYKQAIDAGSFELRAVEDQFYGDRSGNLKDPFGHVWTIATHKEDVTPEQMNERMASAHA
jgi:PhnB protein